MDRTLACVAALAMGCGGGPAGESSGARDAGADGTGHEDAAGEGAAPAPDGSTPLTFEKLTLDTAFRAEGVAVLDVDHDGHLDLATDQYWYAGPTFAPHEISAPQAFDPATQYSRCQAVFPADFDGDGWTDILVTPFMFDPANPPAEPMLWYQNPRGADVHWTPHEMAPATAVETAIFVDLFGDHRREVVMGQDPPLVLSWFAPDAGPTMPWTATDISPTGFAGAGHFTHGLGAGDVNGDGKLDVLTGYGWFQQTPSADAWMWHAFAFGPAPADACSDMYAYDFDGDGLADILCSRPHDYGIHWWQQVAGGSFVDHVIDTTISQMHALDLVDLDGDGTPELVSGKRWWAHGPSGDPGASDPAVLTAYSFVRKGPGDVVFTRHDIDDDSGVGTQFPVTDVDGDGKPDVVVSNKKGLFLFRQR
ncbi:MAG TPA: VCBS repeat-containing protein [Polyangiaceae bacterium]